MQFCRYTWNQQLYTPGNELYLKEVSIEEDEKVPCSGLSTEVNNQQTSISLGRTGKICREAPNLISEMAVSELDAVRNDGWQGVDGNGQKCECSLEMQELDGEK